MIPNLLLRAIARSWCRRCASASCAGWGRFLRHRTWSIECRGTWILWPVRVPVFWGVWHLCPQSVPLSPKTVPKFLQIYIYFPNALFQAHQLALRVLQSRVAQLVEEEAFPIFLVVVSGGVVGLAGQSWTFKMFAVTSWSFLSQQGDLIYYASLYLCDAVVKLSLLAAWASLAFGHRIEIIYVLHRRNNLI